MSLPKPMSGGGQGSMSEFQRGEDIAVGTSGGTDSVAIPKG